MEESVLLCFEFLDLRCLVGVVQGISDFQRLRVGRVVT